MAKVAHLMAQRSCLCCALSLLGSKCINTTQSACAANQYLLQAPTLSSKRVAADAAAD